MAQLTRNLLFQARLYQQKGDLANAIQCAADALAIRPQCSAVHALLGALYEQKGEYAAARRHFQKALSVTPEADDECSVPPEVVAADAVIARQPTGGWVLPVLIGCIVFSGLAALFTLWPTGGNVERGSIILRIIKPKSSPLPRPDFSPKNDTRQPPGPPPAPPVKVENPVGAPNANTASTDGEPKVLGPSVTSGMPALSGEPTFEQAEQAYFNREFERAISIYEKLLTTQDQPNPLIHKRLAECYQWLGNTRKAGYHLQQAINGYREQLENDPADAAAQQELRNCTRMLETLEQNGE